MFVFVAADRFTNVLVNLFTVTPVSPNVSTVVP